MKFTKQLAGVLLAGILVAPASMSLADDLVVGVRAGPASMDPHFTATGANASATKHIYDTLVRSGNNLELEPDLAVSWTPLDDTTWEFKLRNGVKFHDGSDFTAEDVKFSIERIPNVTGPNSTEIYVRRVKEVEIIDPLTIHIVTNGPSPNLPNDFVRLFIVSHTAAADYSTKDTSAEGFNSGKAAIGTGPYKFVSWAPTQDLVLERFDDYWGGAEPWDHVIRKEIPNDATRVAQLKAGQIDIAEKVPATDVATLSTDPELEIIKNESIYVNYLEFDFRENTPQVWAKDGSPLATNPMLDPRVREAFDLAIDRETVVDYALEGLATVPTQLVTPVIFGYDDKLESPVFDLERARALMTEAGYPDGFKITLSYANDRIAVEMGPTLAQMLAAINVEVDVNAIPATVFNPGRQRGEYSLGIGSWGTLTGESNYLLSSLMHSNDPTKNLGAINQRGYANPEMDRLIEEAAVSMDEDERRSLLEQANALTRTDRPSLALATMVTAWAIRKDKVTLTPRSDDDTLAMNVKPVK